MADWRMPFTNSLAEQVLCMDKLHMKIAGGFRTPEGAVCFAQLPGLIETARKQQHNILDDLAGNLALPLPSS